MIRNVLVLGGYQSDNLGMAMRICNAPAEDRALILEDNGTVVTISDSDNHTVVPQLNTYRHHPINLPEANTALVTFNIICPPGVNDSHYSGADNLLLVQDSALVIYVIDQDEWENNRHALGIYLQDLGSRGVPLVIATVYRPALDEIRQYISSALVIEAKIIGDDVDELRNIIHVLLKRKAESGLTINEPHVNENALLLTNHIPRRSRRDGPPSDDSSNGNESDDEDLPLPELSALMRTYNRQRYPPIGVYNSNMQARRAGAISAPFALGLLGGALVAGGAMISLIPVVGTGAGAAAITSGLAAIGGSMIGGVGVVAATTVGGAVTGGVALSAIGGASSLSMNTISVSSEEVAKIRSYMSANSRTHAYPLNVYRDMAWVEYESSIYRIEGEFNGRCMINIDGARRIV